MRALAISFLLFVLLIASSCQKGQGALILELDGFTHNSNFPLNLDSFGPMEGMQTYVIGHSGIQTVGTRSVDVDLPEARFRLTLIDMDQNQRYDEIGTDMVMLSPMGQDSVPINVGAENLGALRKSTIIRIDRAFYLLRILDDLGQTIELLPWERCPGRVLTAQLQTRMKQIPVHDAQGEDYYLDFRKTAGKSTLLVVWNYAFESQTFLTQLQEHKASWAANWEVISINMSDNPQQLKAFVDQYGIDFPTYLMSSRSCQVLDCHALPPYGIVLDANGVILQKGLKAPGLQGWLQQIIASAALGKT